MDQPGAHVLKRQANFPQGALAQYAEPSYWDARYTRQPLEFEWFYGWQALRRVIRSYLPRGKSVLQVGCGNSNLQQKMAESGYKVTNVDISPVVIEQMRERDAALPGLDYVVCDCRDMHMFPVCHFWGAFDKGTIDALMCCKEGATNVTRMCADISRVLRPGCTFLAITLGEPAQRLALLSQPAFDWSVSLLLLPRVPPDHMVQAPGRALPVNDTIEPVRPLGPFVVRPDLSIEGLPEPWDPSQYFYVYACKRRGIELQVANKLRGQLPESWRVASKEAITRLKAETGTDLFSRGVRTRRMSMSQFLAQQQSSSPGSPSPANSSPSHALRQSLLPSRVSTASQRSPGADKVPRKPGDVSADGNDNDVASRLRQAATWPEAGDLLTRPNKAAGKVDDGGAGECAVAGGRLLAHWGSVEASCSSSVERCRGRRSPGGSNDGSSSWHEGASTSNDRPSTSQAPSAQPHPEQPPGIKALLLSAATDIDQPTTSEGTVRPFLESDAASPVSNQGEGVAATTLKRHVQWQDAEEVGPEDLAGQGAALTLKWQWAEGGIQIPQTPVGLHCKVSDGAGDGAPAGTSNNPQQPTGGARSLSEEGGLQLMQEEQASTSRHSLDVQAADMRVGEAREARGVAQRPAAPMQLSPRVGLNTHAHLP